MSDNNSASTPAALWTVDDIVMSEHATELRVSPDARWAVWVRSQPDKEKDQNVSNLYLSSLADDETFALTRGSDDCVKPTWAPDGRHIAFLSQRTLPKADRPESAGPGKGEEPKQQIWLIHPFGGEAWPLTKGERSVTDYDWADSDTIVFAAQEDFSLYERKLKEEKDTSVIVEDEAHEPPVRLFKVSVGSGKVGRLTENEDRIQSVSVSPDGRWAVTIHDRSLSSVYDQEAKPVACLYDLESGEPKQLFPSLNVQQLFWSRDGSVVYAIVSYSTHPQYVMATIAQLYYYDLSLDELAQVDLAWENGIASGPQCLDVTGDGFVALLANGVRHKAARYVRRSDGWERIWLTGEHVGNLFRLCTSKDDETLVYAYSTANRPSQWYRARLDGGQVCAPVQLTRLNPHLEGKILAQVETVRWQGALDQEVEGMLCYPHQYQSGKQYPLVVMIHGGPAGADLDAWSDSWSRPQNLLGQRGAFVLRPNYHGSVYYGLEWAESIAGGRYCDLEVADIEQGVDALVGRGLIDPERLGVMGWSNGGILTIALTVATTRYKAASAGAGDVDWASDWGNCAFGASFDNYYLGVSPFEDPQRYLDKSPFYRLGRVRTPTIIFFGDKDTSVPTQQGWMHYRALQQAGHVDVRFVLFPGEQHSLRKLTHQRRKLREELDWFDQHLFRNPKSESAIKPGSPLDRRLKLNCAEQDRGRYGILIKPATVDASGAPTFGQSGHERVLIPETVPYGGLQIGRFEVTRAQYAEFDPAYAVAPGTDNYPANGVSFEQATAYCKWLSVVTGVDGAECYRLGTRAEMAALYDPKDRVENTLDYWAGYAVNLDDAVRLRQEVDELGSGAPLLKEVGSYQGTDTDEPVYDLGGNVAEWAVAEDGSPCTLGASADTPADRKLGRRDPGPEYIGFRVVKGQGLNATPARST